MSVVPALYTESHPFVWSPWLGSGTRIDQRDSNVPLGAPMRCLGGITHLRGIALFAWCGGS
jgi:hypothetical protein